MTDVVRKAGSGGSGGPGVTREVLADAAEWVVRLHGPDRTAETEAQFLAWQAASGAHRAAFEHCLDIWASLERLRPEDWEAAAQAQARFRALQAARWRRARLRQWMLAIGAAMAGVMAFLNAENTPDPLELETAVGEQRTAVLEDGSRVTLNTATRLRVEFEERRRAVRMLDGEALFEVVSDAHRPFVVRAADTEVKAVGTSFVVRSTGGALLQDVSVTVLEGRVVVRPDLDGRGDEALVRMEPGARLRVRQAPAGPVVAQKDWPPPRHLAAWRHSHIDFDDTSLVEAVAEVNRYTERKIVLEGRLLETPPRVSGRFRTGDSETFARTVAAVWGLQLKEMAGRWALSDFPR